MTTRESYEWIAFFHKSSFLNKTEVYSTNYRHIQEEVISREFKRVTHSRRASARSPSSSESIEPVVVGW